MSTGSGDFPATSAPLLAASFLLEARCRPINDAFMVCRAAKGDPEACAALAHSVLDCTADTYFYPLDTSHSEHHQGLEPAAGTISTVSLDQEPRSNMSTQQHCPYCGTFYCTDAATILDGTDLCTLSLEDYDQQDVDHLGAYQALKLELENFAQFIASYEFTKNPFPQCLLSAAHYTMQPIAEMINNTCVDIVDTEKFAHVYKGHFLDLEAMEKHVKHCKATQPETSAFWSTFLHCLTGLMRASRLYRPKEADFKILTGRFRAIRDQIPDHQSLMFANFIDTYTESFEAHFVAPRNIASLYNDLQYQIFTTLGDIFTTSGLFMQGWRNGLIKEPDFERLFHTPCLRLEQLYLGLIYLLTFSLLSRFDAHIHDDFEVLSLAQYMKDNVIDRVESVLSAHVPASMQGMKNVALTCCTRFRNVFKVLKAFLGIVHTPAPCPLVVLSPYICSLCTHAIVRVEKFLGLIDTVRLDELDLYDAQKLQDSRFTEPIFSILKATLKMGAWAISISSSIQILDSESVQERIVEALKVAKVKMASVQAHCTRILVEINEKGTEDDVLRTRYQETLDQLVFLSNEMTFDTYKATNKGDQQDDAQLLHLFRFRDSNPDQEFRVEKPFINFLAGLDWLDDFIHWEPAQNSSPKGHSCWYEIGDDRDEIPSDWPHITAAMMALAKLRNMVPNSSCVSFLVTDLIPLINNIREGRVAFQVLEFLTDLSKTFHLRELSLQSEFKRRIIDPLAKLEMAIECTATELENSWEAETIRNELVSHVLWIFLEVVHFKRTFYESHVPSLISTDYQTHIPPVL